MICAQDDEGGIREAMDMLAHDTRNPKKFRQEENIQSALPGSPVIGTDTTSTGPSETAQRIGKDQKMDVCAIFSPISTIPETITLSLSVPMPHAPDPRRTRDAEIKSPLR
jgi:hypothetical protein